jgi:hypothetical protein
MRRGLACLLGITVVAATGCRDGGRTQSHDAVRAAIETHLKERQNLLLSNLTLEVQEIKFSGDTAQAEVRFRSKESPDLVVSVRYGLRKGDQGWKVESSSPAQGMGGIPHGAGAVPMPVPGHDSSQLELKSSH